MKLQRFDGRSHISQLPKNFKIASDVLSAKRCRSAQLDLCNACKVETKAGSPKTCELSSVYSNFLFVFGGIIAAALSLNRILMSFFVICVCDVITANKSAVIVCRMFTQVSVKMGPIFTNHRTKSFRRLVAILLT